MFPAHYTWNRAPSHILITRDPVFFDNDHPGVRQWIQAVITQWEFLYGR